MMDVFDPWDAALALSAALLAAGLAVGLMQRLARPVPGVGGLFQDQPGQVMFLFDGETLLDSTPRARALLARSMVSGGDWARLMALLTPRFPDLPAALQGLAALGQIDLSGGSIGSPVFLTVDRPGGVTRFHLMEGRGKRGQDGLDAMAQRATEEELSLLRGVSAATRDLIWQEDADGAVIWANIAYLQASIELSGVDDVDWPLPKLFSPDPGPDQAGLRVALTGADDVTRWFDLERQTRGPDRLFTARPVDAIVRAESTLQSFLQTLTKTFAQLPIGLAIFDKDRKLQLFNPALTDLTGLPADFLTLRPSLLSVLDALRERKMLPEPKDYRSWRHQIAEMEKAAASGVFEDVWNLPDGQIFRITGRPHPNGALAIMLEDISTEILRNRRYRADMELGQAVIDGVDTALAVFAQTGHLVLTNAAYAQLWGHDPDEIVESGTAKALADRWRSMTAPSPLWHEVEDYIATVGDRIDWTAEARLMDGRLVTCRFSPLAGGATLVAFRPGQTAESAGPRAAPEAALQTA